MATYEIVVKRSGSTGTLSFNHAEIAVSTTCWWDPNVVIEPNSAGYASYATQMVTKKRPGIWLGTGVKYSHGTKKSDAIFIHEGKSSAWSDGCIVIERDEMLRIWNSIHPKEIANVLVKVSDV